MMFSPNGYRSLVHAFKAMSQLYEAEPFELSSLFNYAFKDTDGKLSHNRALRYSKKEVLERAFFDIIEDTELFLCSPNGEVYHLEIPFYLNLLEYRHLKHHYWFDTNYFDECLDWAGFEKTADDFLNDGEDSWANTFNYFPNTSINLFYNRSTFLIDTTEHDRLQRYNSTSLSLESEGYPFDVEIVRPFVGWSMCIKDEGMRLFTTETVREAFFKIVFDAAFGIGYFEETVGRRSERNASSSIGRPKKRDLAAKAFLKHFTWETKPDWKTIVKVLKEKEGIDASPKTISRGMDDLEDNG